MNNLMLKYTTYDIVFQEVPNEITLAINISGCPHHCEGCHSKYLWNYTGNYVRYDLSKIIKKYIGMITCVCFMGGDQNLEEVNAILTNIKDIYHLKTCIYSGLDNMDDVAILIPQLDYLKIGRYDKRFGGLNSKITNQVFYKVVDCKLEDITSVFQK